MGAETSTVTSMAQPSSPSPRFLTLDQVAEVLNTTRVQVYALVRANSPPAMKVGGRGQWRVERSRLEDWIEQQHEETARWIKEHPFTGRAVEEDDR